MGTAHREEDPPLAGGPAAGAVCVRGRPPLTEQDWAAVGEFRRFLARAAEVGPDAALAEVRPGAHVGG